MRLRGRLEHLERSAPGCPGCVPQVVRIVEEVVDHPDNVTPANWLHHPARPSGHCPRCGKPVPVTIIVFPAEASDDVDPITRVSA
jgi:hypothetical protein